MLDPKRFARALLGRDWYPRRDLRLPERLGSSYGGWDLVVAGLSRDSVVYSAGIGEPAHCDGGSDQPGRRREVKNQH